MRLVRFLPTRLRNLAPEAMAFAVIGIANMGVYFLVFNALMNIGAVKATVIATVVTTTLSYMANRHWTYKDRPRTALRREYTLFFAFNLAGMVIQSAIVGVGKYGLGLSEGRDRLAFNVLTAAGIGLATLFRFWSYRTFVFKTAPVIAEFDVPAVVPAARRAAPVNDLVDTELELVTDPEFGHLTASLGAELAAADATAVEATDVEATDVEAGASRVH